MKRILIIGAGISGLSLGWFLKQCYGQQIECFIAEALSRPGGWIETHQSNGFLFEQGPRSCRSSGTGIETLRLIEELGLQHQLVHAPKAAYKRYLYIDNQLKALPTGPISLLFSPFAPAIFKALWNDWKAPKSNYDDESVDMFVRRRLGNHAAELFFDPLVAGIYAGEMDKLSMKACFPKLWEWEQLHGSLLKGAFAKRAPLDLTLSPFVQEAKKKGIFTLKDGMETLTTTLAEKLSPHLKLNHPVTSISGHDNTLTAAFQDGSEYVADHIFMAIPPAKAAELLSPHCDTLNTLLLTIPSLSLAVVNLGYHRPLLSYEGFGHLIPSKEKAKILGIVWDSCAFPIQNSQPDQTRLSVMIGENQWINENGNLEDTIKTIALKAVDEQLRINAQPDYMKVKIANGAVPQYPIGHVELIHQIESQIERLSMPITLLGSGYHGVSVNDCVAHSRALVKAWEFRHS